MRIEDNIIELISPEKNPVSFKIILDSNHDETYTYNVFIINGPAPETNIINTITYEIQGKGHAAYLDLFQKISADFGTRTPQNRKNTKQEPSFKVNYRTVLTDNLHPEMFYGYGDPAILKADNKGKEVYYLVSTSNDAANSFPLIKSTDLKNWEFCKYIFPEGNKPAWAAEGESIADYWAPEIHQVNNEFRMYFVAREKASRELCIGLARASHPENTFIPEPEPILDGNVIDPHLYIEDNENVYLFWKEDNNDIWPQKLSDLLFKHPELITELFTTDEDRRTASLITCFWPWAKDLGAMERFCVLQVFIEAVIEQYLSFHLKLQNLAKEKQHLKKEIDEILMYMKTPMFCQKLNADGTKLLGEKTQVMENDLEWEAHLVEGMWVTKHSNKYYLFYAGNDFSTDQYGIGVAIADQVTGPYIKSESQLLKSTKEWLAPGHPSVLQTKEGEYLMFLHAFFPGSAGYKKFRALLEVPIEFEGNKVIIK